MSRTLALLAAGTVLVLAPTTAQAEDHDIAVGDEVEFVRAAVITQLGPEKGEPWSVEKGERTKVLRVIKTDVLIRGEGGERAWTKARFLRKVEAGAAERPAEPVGEREMTLSLSDDDGQSDAGDFGDERGGEPAAEAPAEEPAAEEPAAEEPAAEEPATEEPTAEADPATASADPETEEFTASPSTDLDPIDAEEPKPAESETRPDPEQPAAIASATVEPVSDAPLPTWVALALGGAAVACGALGAGFGMAASDAKASHEEYTRSSRVDYVVVQNLEDRYDDRKLVTNILVGSAGGLAAAAVVALLFSDWGLYGGDTAPAAAIGPTPNGGGVIARAAFTF